ncbi:thioredoxin domain-containing protein [Flavimarina sp. Hel_I_48]|uniref:thioredoxin domain-containing protein n=1 Tax=Flavimarina sp. Hel_I_48 TaxID=1392488 RepID=UPI0009DEB571|nr:thioredoxin domain-containing protein [Flavimarina sp. Hel_I_48]
MRFIYKPYLFLLLLISTLSCTNKKDPTVKQQHNNALINETSPYLLQHAHNPVDWQAWGEQAHKEAKSEDKLMIVSIGYSSCHWCHVMEHESFEDTAVAKVMNSHYVPIKVDREERPDVDNIYMNAVQLMTGQGGWPLNVITLPDGRPVWGGTYFPKENWMDALQQIADIYAKNPEKLVEYADKLEQGLKGMGVIELQKGPLEFDKNLLTSSIASWSKSFDTIQGGMRRAPKFMMPNNYALLLRYGHQENDKNVTDFVHTTLQQMAFGGVYDQIGGGFSRYSTDMKWHVPHFEKMLYDNAQLLSLYSDAYLNRAEPLYKETVYGIVDFLKRDMLDTSGGFYSALDADSMNDKNQLEEGAFYVWTEEELRSLLGDDFPLFTEYYNINSYGLWEHNNYVLIRQDEDVDFIKEQNLDASAFAEKKENWHKILLEAREKRKAPRLDDKILTGWNGLTISGLAAAYKTFNEPEFLQLALKNARFIVDNQIKEDGSLYRTHKNGASTINAYLEDYASVIEGFIALYEVTTDRKWLKEAENLTNFALKHFKNVENGMLYFTSDQDPELIIRNVEYQDNVIPASNSIMANNLFKLGHITFNEPYVEQSGKMLLNVSKEINTYPGGYSNWLDLMLNFTNPFYEVVITGNQAEEKLEELNRTYLPNAIIATMNNPEEYLDLFESRWDDDNTWIYICTNRTCQRPVASVKEALPLLKN